MRIYTEVNFIWDDKQGKLVETSSNSFDYHGELALCVKKPKWVHYWDSIGNKWSLKGSYSTISSGQNRISHIYYYKNDSEYYDTAGPPGSNSWKNQKKVFKKAVKAGSHGKSDDKFIGTEFYGSKEEAYEGQQPIIKTLAGLAGDVGDILKEGGDDEFEEELKTASADLLTTKKEALNALTDFNTNLQNEYDRYLTDKGTLTGAYKGAEEAMGMYEGDPLGKRVWVDADESGTIDAGEIEVTGIDEPGTDVLQSLKDYELAAFFADEGETSDISVAKATRDLKLLQAHDRYGDPFEDTNNDGELNVGETWYNYDPDTGALGEGQVYTEGAADYDPGTEIQSATENWTTAYEAIMGTGDIEEGEEGYIKGSYYEDVESSELKKTEGFEGVALTRGESYKGFREDAAGRISEANAAVAGRGFASSGVGYSQRDQLARELGAEAREIDKAASADRENISITYGEDIILTESNKQEGLNRADTAKRTNLTGHYDKAVAARGETGSEGSLQLAYSQDVDKAGETRNETLITAANTRDIKLEDYKESLESGVPSLQHELEQEAKDTTGWAAASRAFRDTMKAYGMYAGEYADPFALKMKGEGITIAAAAEEEAGIQLGELGILAEEAYGGIDIFEDLFPDYAGSHQDLDKLRGSAWLKDLPGGYSPESGWSAYAAEGEFLPERQYLAEFKELQGEVSGLKYHAPDPSSWLYDLDLTHAKLPWQAEIEAGTWDPTLVI